MSTRPRKTIKIQPESNFGHTFRRPDLLTRALTHRSLSYETNPEALQDPEGDNEQLEFVGDAVLGLVVAESLYRRFPGSREGELTRLRASLVSRKHLADVAARIDLGRSLRLGKGEEQSGGRRKPALLANAMEAVIAALYLDGGLAAAQQFIEQHVIEPTLPDLNLALSGGSTFSGAIGDHKSALQEFLQAAGAGQPQYVLTDQTGPDHQKSFRVEVRIESGISLAESVGTTKKLAQQEAARLALTRLRTEASLLPQPAAAEAAG
ncbi:ribonuclease III [Granulicella arctica]|uniref:ribonuclease III n=1 Tax=Granulicella arctica TaxID=940613 RepID=UPI0021E08F1D|nr:ribonuclease III [Granulicella arctica]